MPSLARPLLVVALCVLGSSAPRAASAQVPSPADAARLGATGPSATSLDLEGFGRLDQARRMRRTGFVLMSLSLATVGTMALVGLADHSCDTSTAYSCVDGPALYAAMGAALVAPVFVTGAAVTTAGYVIERREHRRRISLAPSATGLRLAF